MIGNTIRLKSVADDIVNHFEQRNELTASKAMIIGINRKVCVELFNEIIKLRPHWYNNEDEKGVLKVVMTGSSLDPFEWQEHIRSSYRTDVIAQRFKDPDDKLKLVIVRDMWLTGFDMPCLNTIYLDRPMESFMLLQLISRVSRICEEKTNGLIVDYSGNQERLQEAIRKYSSSGGKGKVGITEKDTLKKINKIHNDLKLLFQDFKFKKFHSLSSDKKNAFLLDATDYILGLEKGKEKFRKSFSQLSYLLNIWHDLFQVTEEEEELSFFRGVNSIIEDLENNKLIYKTDQFIDNSRKNLALEILKNSINQKIDTLPESLKFEDYLNNILSQYNKSISSQEDVWNKLLLLIKEFQENDKEREKLNLNSSEIAFHDALNVENEEVKALGNDNLIKIVKESIEIIEELSTIDWVYKETIQAKMKIAIKRILKKYNYPSNEINQTIVRIIQVAKALL